ncbi:hypothetical protein ATCC90586_006593 [Pythium insidiosum]|nr:hypothetical protein ATCC90586_006593 [Pythium insidiosum]
MPPTAPSSVKALQQRQSLTGGEIYLTWDEPDDSGVKLTTSAASLTIARLSARTEYEIAVAAENPFLASLFTDPPVIVRTLNPTMPSPPQAIRFTALTGGSFNVSWLAPDDSGGAPIFFYRIVVALTSSGDIVSQTDSRTTSIVVFDLRPVTGYSVRVQAVNDEGVFGMLSDAATVVTPSATSPGKPPLPIATQITGGAVFLTVRPPADTGGLSITTYVVLATSAALPSVFSEIYRGPQPSMVMSRLVFLTEYKVRCRVVTNAGASELSDVLSVTTTYLSLPSPPQRIAVVTRGAGSVTLQWEPPQDQGGSIIARYRIAFFIGYDAQLQYETSVDNSPEGLAVSFSSTGLQIIRWDPPIDNGGDEMLSYVLFGVDATDTANPSAVLYNGSSTEFRRGGLRANTSYSYASVTLSLLPPSDTGGAPLTAMRVYHDDKLVRSVTTSGRVQTVLDGLMAETVYSFATTAVSVLALGESDRSLSVAAMTAQATSPSVLYNLAVVAKRSTSLVLSWQGPDETGGQPVTFELEYYDDATGQTAAIDAPSSPFELTNLASSTSYLVRVRARNDAGEGQWAGPVAAQTDVARRGIVVFRPSNVTVMENASEVLLHLARVDGYAGMLSCRYYSTIDPVAWGNVAKEGADFQLDDATSRELVFAEGEALKDVSIRVTNNDIFDAVPRVVVLVIEDTTTERAEPVPLSFGFVNLIDDGDAGAVEFTQAAITVSESARSLLVDLRRVNGSSSAITVRISIDTTMGATARAPDDFGLSKTDYGFGDGETSQRVDLVIRSNTVYDYPFKWFALTLSIISGGGRVGDQRLVIITIDDDGDRSVPGIVTDVAVVRATGGLLQLSWSPPENVGGRDIWIDHYVVTYKKKGSSVSTAIRTQTNASEVPVGSLDALTTYEFQVEAVNAVGASAKSEVISGQTVNATRPGPPQNVTLLRATGGLLQIRVVPPIDMGGVPLTGYQAFVWDEAIQVYEVRMMQSRIAEYWLSNFVPAAETEYVIMLKYTFYVRRQGSSGRYEKPSQRLNARNVNPFFEFANRLFEVDQSRPNTPGVIYFKGAPPAMVMLDDSTSGEPSDVKDGMTASLWARGPPSNVVIKSTTTVTIPEQPYPPELVKATGGALTVRIRSPDDTGGIPIRSYDIYLDNEKVEDPFFSSTTSRGNLQLDVTVVLGGLASETSFELVAIARNDLSACSAGSHSSDSPVIFSTLAPSKPDPVTTLRQASATGGGILVAWDPPLDRGGNESLVYQVWLSSRLSDPVWQIVYNASDTSFWRTKLRSDTAYLFRIACMNSVGSSPTSDGTQLSTSVVSVPGPPGSLTQLDTTGGQIRFEWTPPEDDGGSPVTQYVVEGNGQRYVVKGGTEAVVGKLMAETSYEFRVFAVNELGIGNIASEATFDTAKATPPQPPKEIRVVGTSGGSATIAVTMPSDTGGVALEELTFVVYANGLALPLTATLTNYVITLAVANAIGFSAWSNPIEASTSVMSLPSAPENLVIKSVTNASVTLRWQPCQDLGGSIVETYLIEVVQVDDLSQVVSLSVAISQLEATVEGLVPDMAFTATVRAMAIDGQRGLSSKAVRFVTSLNFGQPPSPVIGCTSVGIVSLLWDAVNEEDGVASYRIYRNDSVVVYSGTDTYVEDNTVALGETYAYTVQHLEIATRGGTDEVRVTFGSDDTVAYEGFELEYEMDPSTVENAPDAAVDVPCPVHPDTASVCGGNGACRDGDCVCFGGFVGEDCSNPVICPSDRTQCRNLTAALACDLICDQDPATVLVVSATGDDAKGTGAMMDTSQGNGTAPKALRSLSRALTIARPGDTILLYPGTHTGSKNCQQTISIPSLTIRGIRGSDMTTLDCQRLDRGLSVVSVAAQLIGFRLVNAIGARGAGGGVAIEAGVVSLKGSEIRENTAVVDGGGLALLNQAQLSTRDTILDMNTAARNGGGIYLITNATTSFDAGSFVTNCFALRGGGLYLQAATVRAVAGAASPNAASIERCIAADEGGGVFLTGSNSMLGEISVSEGRATRGGGISIRDPIGACDVRNSDIAECVVPDVGGGVLLTGASGCTLTATSVRANVAGSSGGGIAVLDSSLRHDAVDISFNFANTSAGGGLFIKSSAAASASVASRSLGDVSTLSSTIGSNSVPEGGSGANAMVLCDRQCELQGFRVANATVSGGLGTGVYVTGKGKTRLTYLHIEQHSAMKGGGVFMTGDGSLEIANSAFIRNAAIWSGGGLYIEGSGGMQLPVTIKDTVFALNTAATSGGAMTLQFADLTAERLLAVENYVVMVDGFGGALHAHDKTNGHIEDGLFLLNRAERGGSVSLLGDSVVTLEDSTLTTNSKALSERWATLYQQRVGQQWASALTEVIDSRRGGLMYLAGTDTILYLTSSEASFGRAEAGGAAFVDTYALLYVSASQLVYNVANEAGGSIALSDEGEAYIELSTVGYSESKNYGGGIFAQSGGRAVMVSSELIENAADDAGGGMYLDTGELVEGIIDFSTVRDNVANGMGSGIYVGRDAYFHSKESRFSSNGGVLAAGKNEGGGAMTGVDANIAIRDCVVENNTAQTGGGILADRGTKLWMDNVSFVANSADMYGGAWVARVKAKVHLNGGAATRNTASSGGVFAAMGASEVHMEASTFARNSASQRGGAGFINGDVWIAINASQFTGNQANLGGAVLVDTAKDYTLVASELSHNVALSRGGALYYANVAGLTTSEVTCAGNKAASGGCIFWITYSANDSATLPPPVPCTGCAMRGNSVYDVATNSRQIEVQWWPSNVTRGVFTMEPADEESFEPLNDTRVSVAASRLIWPRLQAVDLYGQVEVLDVTTRCVATGVPRSLEPNATADDRARLNFLPGGVVKAVAGVVSFKEATFMAQPRELPYALNLTCVLPEKKALWLSRDVVMQRCPPGYSSENTGCVRCPRNRYSLDGVKCFECPSGARCNLFVRRATETKVVEYGTSSPRTSEGFYLFKAPSTRQTRFCDPMQWRDTDPCKSVAEELPPGTDVATIVQQCTLQPKFRDSWPANRVFSCLSGRSFYSCDIESACKPDITVEEQSSRPANKSCGDGYDQAVCSVCAFGFKKGQDGNCLPCDTANAEMRTTLRWQNFVIPTLLVLAILAAVAGLRYYLRDMTEIALLEKAEADRRLRPPRPKHPKQKASLFSRAKDLYHSRIKPLRERALEVRDEIKAKILARLRRHRRQQPKTLFGIEVEPSSHRFPIKPSKLKIFIGFFQIFGNFRDAFVIKWSSNVQNLMNFSSKFNLDLVAIAGVDCVITKTFYFDFTVTIILVVFTLSVITAYLYAGMRNYHTKLLLIPRNCLRCGLPVLESEKLSTDEVTMNPFLMARIWFRERLATLTARVSRRETTDSSVAQPPSPSRTSMSGMAVKGEARHLKRELGMSQVRTPHLGLFRSEHRQCPTSHTLRGVILERTIRSNLRVWQARIKLRMNYLTYRNKCLKLYCWLALFLYPTVSKTILMIFNCEEVGDVFYMAVDRRIVCYNASWAIFGVLAIAGVVVWVIGIPFFFWLLIRRAQDRGIARRIKLLNRPQCRNHRRKWLAEMLAYHTERGIIVPEIENREVQDVELAKYMKHKNLTDSTVQARLGFIYADYSEDYWWFEVVDLSRKLFLSGVIVFVENGSVEQVLLAITVCLVTMWFLLFFQPYGDFSDNLIASITQLQLFLTLWLGVMTQLNAMNEESLINEKLLSYMLVSTCVAVTLFGVGMIIRDGVQESRRLFLEEKADRKKRIQKAVAQRWQRAFNYACYEVQVAKFGALNLRSLSVPAMLEAFRRLKQDADALAAIETRLAEVVEEDEEEEEQ